ncbi:MAG: N-acetylmuramoyl-L-alanine amidase [Melioribacteraceae bacterium]
MKLFKLIFFFLLIYHCGIYSQRTLKISVEINNEKFSLSYISKNGKVFVSSKELAEILSANFYYNPETQKVELKFQDYTLRVTAKNSFIVLIKRENNSQEVFQLPLNTLLINNDIFIPINFMKEYLSIAAGKNFIFDSSTRTLTICDETNNNQNKVRKPSEQNYDISDISIEEKINGTLIRFKANKKIILPRYSIHNNVLYVFFVNANVNPDVTKNLASVGLVKNCKFTITSAQNSQLEFSLNDGYSTIEIFQDKDSNDIILTIHNKNFIEKIKNNDKTKWQFDVVVIDAGHGGKDPGAIGITGVKEKDINLKIALKLGKLIEKNLPSVKVVYTRKSDEFIELYKRGKIANEAGGKLFISIHCNSTPQKNISNRGFEVYLLRPGRTKEAIEIAEFENSVIKYEDNPQRYQQLTDENFILVTMAHSQYMRYSEMFSDLLNEEWKNTVKIPTNGIKQAGFYVLVGASMPSVLIETGYLSNRKDEAYLKSNSGQNEIAKAIFNAIIKYKEFYDKEIDILSKNENKK